MVLGLRAFPHIQGGVETHAAELYPRLARLGCRIEVLVRSPYWPKGKPAPWSEIRFRRLWSPRSRGIEAFAHSFLGVLYAAVRRPDLLHIHAIGPALFTPLARLAGLRTVITHHGPDYDREKWGSTGRMLLRLGERLGVVYANECIAVSRVIQNLLLRKYGRQSQYIPNGVMLRPIRSTHDILDRFGLEPGRYVLHVSRFVPEKRHIDLIKAFSQASLNGWKLVLVGGLDPGDDYARQIQQEASRNANVLLTGFQGGGDLEELYSNAGLFVLPSSHEGHPIALLEALSYGLPVIASDIAANVEIGLAEAHYFPLGDIDVLSQRLTRFVSMPLSSTEKERTRSWVASKYDWDAIARETLITYKTAVGDVKHRQKIQSLDGG